MRMSIYAALLCLALGTAVTSAGLTACSGSISQGKGAAVATGGVDLAVCVLTHWGETPPQIVHDCGAGTVQDVVKIIDAHKAAEIQEFYAGADGGGAPILP